MMRSMSFGVEPGVGERALARPSVPSIEVVSPSAAMWRSLMPVRCTIHSWEVSTMPASSWFVRTRSGR